jgi:hypothetical protein
VIWKMSIIAWTLLLKEPIWQIRNSVSI